MDDTIRLSLGTGTYNASLLGLYRVLQSRINRLQLPADSVVYDGRHLIFKADMLDGLQQDWIDAMIYANETYTAFYALTAMYGRAKAVTDDAAADKKAVDDFIKELVRKGTSASYKSAYVIIGDETDMEARCKQLKKLPDDAERMAAAAPIMEFFREHRRVFLMKDIAYQIINQFWGGIAFFNNTKNKTDMEKCVADDIVGPACSFTAASAGNASERCVECGAAGAKIDMKPMTWILDMGMDDSRKKSNFWNFRPDMYICPVCALVYSCLPLGFTMVGSQGIFINANESFAEMVNVNTTFTNPKIFTDIAERKPVAAGSAAAFRARRTAAYLALCQTERAREQRQSVQVILRMKDKNGDPQYTVDTLSPRVMTCLDGCRDDMLRLSNRNVKLGEKNYINLFGEVVGNMCRGADQHDLIMAVLRAEWTQELPPQGLQDVIKAQVFFKGGNNMEANSAAFRKTLAIMKEGNNIRHGFGKSGEGKDEINNKLRGFAYKLLNQANARDRHGFMDTLMRMYMGVGMPLPLNLFSEAFNDDEAFMTFADAYIAGLSGEYYEKKNDSEEAKGE